MAKCITVRGVTLGAGRPKICVPLVAASRQPLIAEAKAALAAGAEVVEWRADLYLAAISTHIGEAARYLCALLEELRRTLGGDMPLLFTLRSMGEGGQCPFDEEDTVYLLQKAAESGMVDMIDVELSMDEICYSEAIEEARVHDVKTIVSHHRFDATPTGADMLAVLHACQAVGADVAKLAVMPKSTRDVLTLLAVTDEFHRTGNIPLVTMSMGALGAVSRLCGEAFGSCMTFGAGEHASAPGQIDARLLAQVLNAMRLGEEA